MAAQVAFHTGRKRRRGCHLHCRQGTRGEVQAPSPKPSAPWGRTTPAHVPHCRPQPPCGSDPAQDPGRGRSRTKGWQPFPAWHGVAGRAGGPRHSHPLASTNPLVVDSRAPVGTSRRCPAPLLQHLLQGQGSRERGHVGEQPGAVLGHPTAACSLPVQTRASHLPGSGTQQENEKIRARFSPAPPAVNRAGKSCEDATELTAATRKAAESKTRPFLSGKEPTYQMAQHARGGALHQHSCWQQKPHGRQERAPPPGPPITSWCTVRQHRCPARCGPGCPRPGEP